ncbi:unnamed protein product [Lota lota]
MVSHIMFVVVPQYIFLLSSAMQTKAVSFPGRVAFSDIPDPSACLSGRLVHLRLHSPGEEAVCGGGLIAGCCGGALDREREVGFVTPGSDDIC